MLFVVDLGKVSGDFPSGQVESTYFLKRRSSVRDRSTKARTLTEKMQVQHYLVSDWGVPSGPIAVCNSIYNSGLFVKAVLMSCTAVRT